jgi:hypothetical protein
MGLVEITDFGAYGWCDANFAAPWARRCCEQLERGEILWLRDFPVVGPQEREFLTQVRQVGSGFIKNISYQAQSGRLRGFDRKGTDAQTLKRVLGAYADGIQAVARQLLAPYAPLLEVDFTSFRPIEERGRDLRGRSRNDLLHVDSFPTRPARGKRILRFFTNIHPSEPRVWITSETLAALAPRMAPQAGLASCARKPNAFATQLKGLAAAALRPAGIRLAQRSPYDLFMLRFHDYLKANQRFQHDCQKQFHEFPPGSTWVVFTDMVPHAVLSGQYALEHTFFVPVSAMVMPEMSPLRILESIARAALA